MSHDDQELAELVALITDLRQTPAARSFFVRELLDHKSEASSRAVAEILTSSTEEAVLLSVCRALFEVELPDESWVTPLLNLAKNHNGAVRESAIWVLSNYHSAESAIAVGGFISNAAHSPSARLGVMEILGELAGTPEAIDALIEALDDPRSDIRARAHGLLLKMGLADLGPDSAAWCAWWAQHRQDSPVPRLRAILKRKKSQLHDSEQARAAAMATNLSLRRELYDRLGDAEKLTRLVAFLRDREVGVRVLGIELVNAMIADRKDIPVEVLEPLRNLVNDPAGPVRAKTVPVLRDLRNPADTPLLLERLARETDEMVLCELLNALGRLGDLGTVPHLVVYLSSDYPQEVVGEAADSVGLLLAARRPSQAAKEVPVVREAANALLTLFENMLGGQTELRERVLNAMANVSDPSFAPSFLAHIDDARSGMKLASIRGIAALADPAHLPLLVRHLADPVGQVRQIAAEAVGRLGDNEDHLEVLLARLDSKVEPTEAIRSTAWEAFVRLFGRQVPAVQLRWADRLDPKTHNSAAAPERFVRLLLEMEKALTGLQQELDVLAEVRLRLAETYADMGRHADALSYHQQVYEWLKSQPRSRARQVGVKVLRSQLATERFTMAVDHLVFLLGNSSQQDESPFRQVIREFIRQRLETGRTEDVLMLIGELSAPAIPELSESWCTELESLRSEALELRRLHDREQVLSWAERLAPGGEGAEQARRQILELGRRAADGLAQSIQRLLDDPNHEAATEAELVALAKQVQPDWPGYELDAPIEQKREVLLLLKKEE